MDGLTITGEHIFHDQKIHAADPALTQIFSFDILHGSLQEFQQQNHTAILSSAAALQYFGTIQATGKKIKVCSLGDTLLFYVVAVVEDYPQNSHEEFRAFIRFDSTNLQTLGFSPKESGVYGKTIDVTMARFEKKLNNRLKSARLTYRFQPISEIYFGPRAIGEDTRHGDHYSIIILLCVTSLIFFLALTNYINLTTLTLPQRSKELAVKKLGGTSEWHLLFDFAQESFWIVGVSLVLGLLLLLVTSDIIEPLLALDLISLIISGDIVLVLVLVGLALILGIAPLFMAIKCTRATPIRLLSTDTISFPRFKRIIIVLQLGISIFLIVVSMVMRRQIDYSLLKEPGRNHDQVVYLSYPNSLTYEGLRSLRTFWKNTNPNIVDVLAVAQMPDQINSKELNSDFYFMSVDPDFINFFDLKMVEGNWFKANAGDSILVVNEKAKDKLEGQMQNVIGVFEDISGRFNLPEKPLKVNIAPYYNFNFLCIRILEVDIRRTVQYLATYFGQDSRKVSVSFLNKRFEEWLLYQNRLNALSNGLAIISGLLSCCAIYGLSLSIVRDKLKQIAIHKLCGATSLNITRLLVKEFLHQLLMAILIFGPLTYIILKELLRSFVYSTHFHWLDPLIPLVYCASVITLLCGFQVLSLNREDLSSALKG